MELQLENEHHLKNVEVLCDAVNQSLDELKLREKFVTDWNRVELDRFLDCLELNFLWGLVRANADFLPSQVIEEAGPSVGVMVGEIREKLIEIMRMERQGSNRNA